MNSLREIQNDFLAYLLAPGAQMQARVVDDMKVGAARRLNIYAEAYRLRLLEALAENYTGLHALLGGDDFNALGRAYIELYPSRHFSVRYFGHCLSEFLARDPRYQDRPVLGEMAAFEWMLRDVFDAGDASVLTMDDLRALPLEAWQALRLELHPSVRRLDLQWNVPELWNAIEARGALPVARRFESPMAWLAWRKDLRTLFRSLAVDEVWAIDAVRAGETFADLCAALCEWVDVQHAPARAAVLVQQWLNDGIVCGWHYE